MSLPEVVVDAVDLPLVKVLVKLLVDRASALQVATERLFHDQAAEPALIFAGEAGVV